MRIAMFADALHREGSSVARSLLTGSRALARRGHALMLVTPRGEDTDGLGPDLTPDHENLGPEPTMLRLSSLPGGAGLGRLVVPTGFAALRCRPWAPDVIHSQTPFGAGLEALVAARLLGVPLIATSHGSIEHFVRDRLGSPTPSTSVPLRYVRWYYGRCDLITSPSENLVGTLRERGLSVPAGVVRDPLPFDGWPGASRPAQGKPRPGLGGFTPLYVGHLTEE